MSHHTPPSGVIIEIASNFFPSARLPGAGDEKPDMIVFTADSVFFYCHRKILTSRSSNSFAHLLSSSNSSSAQSSTQQSPSVPGLPHGMTPLLTITVAESSSVFNVILHIIYDMPVERFGPDLTTIVAALGALRSYGIACPSKHSNVWSLVLYYARTEPIRAFSVAAFHSMESLCVQISALTLPVPLNMVSEADALTMGPLYLRRLFFLHLGRKEALKRVIDPPPATHSPTPVCSAGNQATTADAWKFTVTEALLRPMPQALRAEELRQILGAAAQGRTCQSCANNIRDRVTEAVQTWEAIKTTI